MKKIAIPCLLVLTLLLSSFKRNESSVATTNIKVEAPFTMPEITVPDFKKCKTFSIVSFGAIPGDKVKTTQAIAAAISEANKIGGGVVIIPEGEWLTGTIHFKSYVNLHLNKGAVLLFDDVPSDYLPAVNTSWEGMECMNYSPLIYAWKCKNIAITGEGTIKAKMNLWTSWAGRPRPHMESLKRLYNMSYQNVPTTERMMVNDTAHLRPHLIQFNRCENIRLEGFSIVNSPFWTIHMYLSKNILLRKLNVYAHGHNNDGFDPEMSQNILVENCQFDQGDDAIAIKSGRNQEGWRIQVPTKNLVIRNCTVKNGHQLIAVGSELSGGIENVYVHDCVVNDGAKMFHLVFIKTNERMGGYVNNIYIKNIKAGKMDLGILGIETDVLYQWKDLVPTYVRKLTPIKNIYLENVKASNVQFESRIFGQKELPVENISLKNVTADSVRGKQKHIQENVINFKELK
jgi:polygalacturonase